MICCPLRSCVPDDLAFLIILKTSPIAIPVMVSTIWCFGRISISNLIKGTTLQSKYNGCSEKVTISSVICIDKVADVYSAASSKHFCLILSF